MQVACDFRWEMGHRIPEHAGLCRNVHGHSYQMRVVLEGEVQPSGMLIDFFDLKNLVTPMIESLDHAFMCAEHDTLMRDFLRDHGMKVVLVPFTTTVENLVEYMLDAFRTPLSRYSFLRSVTVRVRETDSSYAEATTILNAHGA